MRFDLALTVSYAAMFLVWLSFAAQWRSRARQRTELAKLQVELDSQKAASSASFSELNRDVLALREEVRTPPEPPRAGGLNRSARAQALQLLRSGVSPESAATSLGMGKREMRLLEQVSQTLYAR